MECVRRALYSLMYVQVFQVFTLKYTSKMILAGYLSTKNEKKGNDFIQIKDSRLKE